MITVEHLGNEQPTALPMGLQHLFSYRVAFDLPPEFIGPTPDGVRINFSFSGGEVIGPYVNGAIRASGGDWLTVRPDGVGILDMRMTIETDDGATIYVPDLGVLDHGEDGFQNALQGQLLPNGTPFQVAPRLQTSHPDYLWLNRLQCVGVGRVFPELGEARCDIYAVR